MLYIIYLVVGKNVNDVKYTMLVIMYLNKTTTQSIDSRDYFHGVL